MGTSQGIYDLGISARFTRSHSVPRQERPIGIDNVIYLFFSAFGSASGVQHLRVQHRLIEVTVNDLYEGQIFLSSWRHGSQEETEDATAACLPAVLRKEAERGVGVGGGILSQRFYFYSSTSLTVTPSPLLLSSSIPHLQSGSVAMATASHISPTTPSPPHLHLRSPAPPLQCRCSDDCVVAETQRIWAASGKGDAGVEDGKGKKKQKKRLIKEK